MLPGRTAGQLRAEEEARARRRLIGRIATYAAIGLAVIALGWLFSKRRQIRMAYRDADEVTRGKDWASRLDSSEDVLAYILEHPNDVSIAMWDVGHHAEGLFLGPDVPRPLASTVKIQVLTAYAAAASRGELKDDESVQVAAWEAHYLPNTDGGSHVDAMHALGLQVGASTSVHLRDVVHAMVRYSDNAATDYLLSRLGRAMIDAMPKNLGLTLQEEPARPLVGQLLLWNTPPTETVPERLDRLTSMKGVDYVDLVWNASKRLADDSDDDVAALRTNGGELSMVEQETFAQKLGIRGTAEGYAYLMQKVARRDLPRADMVYDELSWPMKGGTIKEQFDEFGTKGGSVAGVLTAAYFARPRGGHLKVLALFFSELPGAVWLSMSNSFVQQTFARRLMLDDTFRDKVKTALAAVTSVDGGADGGPSDAAADALDLDADEFDANELLEELGIEAGPSPKAPKPPRKAPRR